MGTCAAVFVALFGPVIQRLVVRKRVNALFAVGLKADLMKAMRYLEEIRRRFDFKVAPKADWYQHQAVINGGERAAELQALTDALEPLSGREVDLTKWSLIDLSLASKVALAIDSVKDFRVLVAWCGSIVDDDDWQRTMTLLSNGLRRASIDVVEANVAAARAAKHIGQVPLWPRSRAGMRGGHAKQPIA